MCQSSSWYRTRNQRTIYHCPMIPSWRWFQCLFRLNRPIYEKIHIPCYLSRILSSLYSYSLPQEFSSRRCIQITPFRATFECSFGGFNSYIHVGFIAFGNQCNCFSCGRIQSWERLARDSVNELIVDENLYRVEQTDNRICFFRQHEHLMRLIQVIYLGVFDFLIWVCHVGLSSLSIQLKIFTIEIDSVRE